MPKYFRWSTTNVPNADQHGNVWIANNQDNQAYGPTSTTGFYVGIDAAVGGYTLYFYDGTNNYPYIYTPPNNNTLISIYNHVKNTNFTNATDVENAILNDDNTYLDGGVVIDGVVLYMDIGNTRSYPGSGSAVNDLSALNNDLTIVGATYSSDTQGVLVFDGTDDLLYGAQSTDLYNIETEMTMEAWFRNTGTPTGGEDRTMILNKENSFEMALNSTNGQFQWAIFSEAQSWTWLGSSDDLRDGEWHHGVVTRDENALETSYVDGIQQSQIQRTDSPVIERDNRINIGARGGNTTSTNSNWSGSLSVVRLYNKALTANEVLSNYSSSMTRYS